MRRRLTIATATTVMLIVTAAGAHAWPTPCVDAGYGSKGVDVCIATDPCYNWSCR
jgi:hypothetical protein